MELVRNQESIRRMAAAPKKNLTQRNAWEDRFRTPTAQALCDGMNRQFASLFDTAREKLRGFSGMVEQLSWEGLPWRWTMTYRLPPDNGRAWAYLVPDPNKPQIALPIPVQMVSALPMHRYKKHVKDGVLLGRMVDGVYWASWDITSKPQLTEVLELVQHKHNVSTKKPAPAPTRSV